MRHTPWHVIDAKEMKLHARVTRQSSIRAKRIHRFARNVPLPFFLAFSFFIVRSLGSLNHCLDCSLTLCAAKPTTYVELLILFPTPASPSLSLSLSLSFINSLPHTVGHRLSCYFCPRKITRALCGWRFCNFSVAFSDWTLTPDDK